MSKNSQIDPGVELDEEIEFEDELEEGDYAFIFDSDGELKNVYLPADFEIEPPEMIVKILSMLGVTDINSAWLEEGQYLH